MKRFLLVVMFLASAASLYAAELKITGDAEVRGVMDQVDRGDTEIYGNMYFDADFNFNAALVVTENTTVFTKVTFDSQADYVGLAGTDTVDDSLATEPAAVLGVERAYISTKFLPALTVDAGLMGGGMWGTAFGNSESNVTRIKGTYAVSEDMKVMAIYEKNTESKTDPTTAPYPTNLSDLGDRTTYYVAASLKFGQFTVLPLVKYIDMADARTTALDNSPFAYAVDVAVTGDMGMIGFEFEAVYANTDGDGNAALDSTTYGVYVDVFAKLEPAKVGLAAFYAGATEDGVYNPGADFDFLLIAGEQLVCPFFIPPATPTNQDMSLAGMTAFKLYADAKVMEKVEAGAAFAYGMSNDKDYAGDVTFWEVDANVAYLIDANTSWTLEGGYASYDDGGSDPLTSYRVQQKISVKF